MSCHIVRSCVCFLDSCCEYLTLTIFCSLKNCYNMIIMMLDSVTLARFATTGTSGEQPSVIPKLVWTATHSNRFYQFCLLSNRFTHTIGDCNKIAKGTSFILSVYMLQIKFNFLTRENEGTQREAQGVGRDMSCPRKLFLDERKSLF